MSDRKNKRELIREKRIKRKRRRMITVVFISIAAAVLFGAAVFLPKFLNNSAKYDNTSGFSVGDPNAAMKVVEFSSYSCSYCRSFSENNEREFISEYVDSGEVYYTYVNLPANSEQSLAAAEASYCAAEQNKFFEYKDLLFTYAGYSDSYSTSNLIKYANSAGLDADEFQACLGSDKYAEAYLDDYDYAGSIGLTGTPSFMVNDTLVYSNELIQTVEYYLQN